MDNIYNLYVNLKSKLGFKMYLFPDTKADVLPFR